MEKIKIVRIVFENVEFTIFKKTLMCYPDCLLTRVMLNEELNDKIFYKDNVMFISRNPKYFSYLLDYLKGYEIPDDVKELVKDDADFYNINIIKTNKAVTDAKEFYNLEYNELDKIFDKMNVLIGEEINIDLNLEELSVQDIEPKKKSDVDTKKQNIGQESDDDSCVIFKKSIKSLLNVFENDMSKFIQPEQNKKNEGKQVFTKEKIKKLSPELQMMINVEDSDVESGIDMDSIHEQSLKSIE